MRRTTVDLTASPDVDELPSDLIVIEDDVSDPSTHVSTRVGDAQFVSEAACLQMVLSVFPDIAVDHVLGLIQDKTNGAMRTTVQCEQIVSQLLDAGVYPKEADAEKSKKRKREDGDDLSDYEKAERDPAISGYEADASALLKDEFLSVPRRHINNVLREHRTLFRSYGILEEQVRNYRRIATHFSYIARARNKSGIELILIERGSQLPKELHAAKRKSEREATKRRKAEEAEQAEETNLQKAQMNNEMGECACCYSEVPLNRMISCNGDTVHMYCLDCPRQQIETQMGQSRCRPRCFGVVDCNGTFSRGQLQQILSVKSFERLEHMQQLEDLKAAGLDFLSECPFCDFKMECLPVEVDKEFRCQNPKCGKTSCRLCQKISHIPLNCEEAKKDGQLTLRHIVEEAMSAALIRHCNRCKHPFIKEHGCNKMICTHCRNMQCYVCSKDVSNYQHFGELHEGKCPLHDNIESRHEQEVRQAAEEAMAKVRADNPGVSDADLMIQVSDRVKREEAARRDRAGPHANLFPHMVDAVPRARPRPQRVRAPPLPPMNQPADHMHRNPALPPIPVVVPPPELYQLGPLVDYLHHAPQPWTHQPQGLPALVHNHPYNIPRFGDGRAGPQHLPIAEQPPPQAEEAEINRRAYHNANARLDDLTLQVHQLHRNLQRNQRLNDPLFPLLVDQRGQEHQGQQGQGGADRPQRNDNLRNEMDYEHLLLEDMVRKQTDDLNRLANFGRHQ